LPAARRTGARVPQVYEGLADADYDGHAQASGYAPAERAEDSIPILQGRGNCLLVGTAGPVAASGTQGHRSGPAVAEDQGGYDEKADQAAQHGEAPGTLNM
jgi:hypothetical protein